MKYNRKEGNIMWKNFLKRSGWTDIVISLIFILFGAMLIARPESIMSIVAILLGVIFIVIGVLRTVDYFASNKEDNYLIAMALASIVIGIVIMFCSDIILSAFRILIAIWIIYSGIINLQTTIVWKDYKSRLWLLTLILAISMIIAGIYILVNSGAILQTVGVAIVVYGIVDIIENIIFIKKVDDLSQKIIEKSLDTQKQINEYILAKQKIITFKYSDKNKIEEAQKLEKEKAEEEIKKIIGNQILNFERALLNQKIEDDKTMYYNETESLIWRIFNCVYFSARQEEKYVKNFEIKYKKQLSKQAKKDIAINKMNASSFNWEK